MLSSLSEPIGDPLWALARTCQLDPRPSRMDLVLGVYRNDKGQSPVMEAVQEAERRLAERAPSKEYKSLSGILGFNARMEELILGPALDPQRVTSFQTVAGTGALRMLAELIARANPEARVLIGIPSYANHIPIFRAAGLVVRTFPYLDQAGRPSGDAILSAIETSRQDDVLVLQGCCHNPTGTDISPELWREIAQALNRTGVVPLIDLAYYGLGNGLEEDLAGARSLVAEVPRALIAVSGSKAFSLYSERVGCAIVVSEPSERSKARGTLESIARSAYSQPPEHGAAIIEEILSNDGLKAQWVTELNSMRNRLTWLRRNLVAGLFAADPSAGWEALGEHRGMFTTLPFSPDQMGLLGTAHAVYGTPQGRLNLAGISSKQLPQVVAAISAVAGSAMNAPRPASPRQLYCPATQAAGPR